MSMRSVAKCYQETSSFSSKILSGERVDVDYFAIVDGLIANGHVPPEERAEHVRATMNAILWRLADDLVGMYSKDTEKFKKAFPKYLDFVLDPVYDETAPEAVISSLITLSTIPRNYRTEVDSRSDLMIARINHGTVGYAYPDVDSSYTAYLQNRQKDKQ